MAIRHPALVSAAVLAAALPLAACSRHGASPAPAPSPSAPAPANAGPPAPSIPLATQSGLLPGSPSPEATPATPLAAGLVRAQWHLADNWADCAPVVFTSDGGAPGHAHAQQIAGGWAVAFDRPGQKSAYGIVGQPLSSADNDSTEVQINRLLTRWHHFKRLPALPEPAFAGYGLTDGRSYPADNADGRGLRSIAEVRIGGQSCTYKVWSVLGRSHLEALLASLRML